MQLLATVCKNCAAQIIFDPKTQKVVCHTCGSSWDPQTVDVHEEFPDLQDFNEENEDADEIYKHFMACKVYTCQSCGGEIFVHGSEASTNCIYCGNSSVIFSRISKEKAPDFVLPFQTTPADAVASIRKAFKRHAFIPKEIRKINPDMVRGIYIPYKIVNGRHFEAVNVCSHIRRGDRTETIHTKRSGFMQLRNLPVDASVILSDESSQQLEPYDLNDMKPFNESYLLGFYSNAADASDEMIQQAANVRGINAFHSQVIKTVRGFDARVTRGEYETYINKHAIMYALFPVWFATCWYEGQHHTILINAQTGKVVGGLPWDKKAVDRLTRALSILFTIFCGVVLYGFYKVMGKPANFKERLATLFMPVLSAVCGIGIWVMGKNKMKKVMKYIHLTQDSSLFKFVKKRQG